MRTPLAGTFLFQRLLPSPPSPSRFLAKNTEQEEVFAQGCWWDRDYVRKEGHCPHTGAYSHWKGLHLPHQAQGHWERSPPADQTSLPGRHQVSLCVSSLYRLLALLPNQGPQGHLSCLSDSWHNFLKTVTSESLDRMAKTTNERPGEQG